MGIEENVGQCTWHMCHGGMGKHPMNQKRSQDTFNSDNSQIPV